MSVKFQVKMSRKALFDFLLNHTYRSFGGWISVIIGIVVLIAAIVTFGDVSASTSAVYFFFAAYFLPLQPALLYFRAAKQMKLNPVYKEPLYYVLDDEGITSRQKKEKSQIGWDQIVKVTETRCSLLLYTGKRYSFILPKEDIGNQLPKVKELIKKHLKAEQVKI